MLNIWETFIFQDVNHRSSEQVFSPAGRFRFTQFSVKSFFVFFLAKRAWMCAAQTCWHDCKEKRQLFELIPTHYDWLVCAHTHKLKHCSLKTFLKARKEENQIQKEEVSAELKPTYISGWWEILQVFCFTLRKYRPIWQNNISSFQKENNKYRNETQTENLT